jgi:hypothetical protein
MDSGTFHYGKLRVQCVATMFHLYHEEAETILEEERPRLASVLGTRESSLGKCLHLNALSFSSVLSLVKCAPLNFSYFCLLVFCSLKCKYGNPFSNSPVIS